MGGRKERIEITLHGGRPWGFSIKGGSESNKPLVISKVEPRGKAERSGLCVGDNIYSVNNVPLSGMREEAIKLVKTSGSNLVLEIERGVFSNGDQAQQILYQRQSHMRGHSESASDHQHFHEINIRFTCSNASGGCQRQRHMSPVEIGHPENWSQDRIHSHNDTDHPTSTDNQSRDAADFKSRNESSISLYQVQASHLDDITNMVVDDPSQGTSPSASSLPAVTYISSTGSSQDVKRRSDEGCRSWNSVSSCNASSESLDKREAVSTSQGSAMRHRRSHNNRNTERPNSWHASKYSVVEQVPLSPTSSSPTPTLEDKRMRFPGDDGYQSPHHVPHSYFSHSHRQHQSKRKSKGWAESGDLRSALKGDGNGSKDSILSWCSRQSNRSSRLSCSSSKSSGNMSGSRGSIDNLDSYYGPEPGKSSEDLRRNSPAATFNQHSRKGSSPSEVHAGNVSSKKHLFEKMSHGQHATGKVGGAVTNRTLDLEDPRAEIGSKKTLIQQPYHEPSAPGQQFGEAKSFFQNTNINSSRKSSLSPQSYMPQFEKYNYQTYVSDAKQSGKLDHTPRHEWSEVNICHADARVVTSTVDIERAKIIVEGSSSKTVQLKGGAGSQLPVFASAEPEKAAHVYPVNPISPSIASPVTEDLKSSEGVGGQQRLFGVMGYGNDGKNVVAKTITIASPQRTPISSPVLRRAKQDKVITRKSSTSPSRYEYLSDAYSGSEPFPNQKHPPKLVNSSRSPGSVMASSRQRDIELPSSNEVPEPYFKRSNVLMDKNKSRASGKYGEVWKTPQVPRRAKFPEPNNTTSMGSNASTSTKMLANVNTNNSKLSVFKPLVNDEVSPNSIPFGGATNLEEHDMLPTFSISTGIIQPSLDAKSRKPIYQSTVFESEEDQITKRLGATEGYNKRENSDITKQERKPSLMSKPVDMAESPTKLPAANIHKREITDDPYAGMSKERISAKQASKVATCGVDEAEEDELFMSHNDEYRNNIKVMSKKVLRVTSFTRKDLELSPSFRMFEQQRQAFEFSSRLGATKEEEERNQILQYNHRRSKSQGNDLEDTTPVGRLRAGTAGERLVLPSAKSQSNYPNMETRPKSAGVRDNNNHRMVQSVCLSASHHHPNKTSPEHRRIEIEVRPPEFTVESLGKSKPPPAIARRLAQTRSQDTHLSKVDARNAVLGFYYKKTGKALDSVKKTSRAKSMSQFPQPTSPVSKETTSKRSTAVEERTNRPRTGPMRAKSTSSLLDVESSTQLSIVPLNYSSRSFVHGQCLTQRSTNDLRSSSMEDLTADTITSVAETSSWSSSANSNLQNQEAEPVVHGSTCKLSPTGPKQVFSSPESTAKVAPFMYQLLQAKMGTKNDGLSREEKSLGHGSVLANKNSRDSQIGLGKTVNVKPSCHISAAVSDPSCQGKPTDGVQATSVMLPASAKKCNKELSAAHVETEPGLSHKIASGHFEDRNTPDTKCSYSPKGNAQRHRNDSSRSPDPLPQAPQRRRRKKGQASLTSSSSSSDANGMNVSPSRSNVSMTRKISVASMDMPDSDLPLPHPPESLSGVARMRKKQSVSKMATLTFDLPPPPPPPPTELEDELLLTPKKDVPHPVHIQATPAVADTYREETYLLGTDSSSEGDPTSKRNSRDMLSPSNQLSRPVATSTYDNPLLGTRPDSSILNMEVLHAASESMDTVISADSHETISSEYTPSTDGKAVSEDKIGTDPAPAEKTTPTFAQGILSSTLDMLETGYWFAKSTPADIFLNTPSEHQRTSGVSSSNLPVSSTYYHTSASKAKIMHLVQEKVEGGEIQEDVESEEEINRRKIELVASICNKMSELQKVKDLIKIEMKENEELGIQVKKLVEITCTSKEREKYSTFVEEVSKIINLILSISGRLARVENALSVLPPDPELEERISLLEKREKLLHQQEEADTLKENVDNRQKAVSEMLSKYFDSEQFTDYEHYIKMKMTLIMEKRELDDKMKLGEEQMQCLRDSLPDDWHRKLDAILEEQKNAENSQQQGQASENPRSSRSLIASDPD